MYDNEEIDADKEEVKNFLRLNLLTITLSKKIIAIVEKIKGVFIKGDNPIMKYPNSLNFSTLKIKNEPTAKVKIPSTVGQIVNSK